VQFDDRPNGNAKGLADTAAMDALGSQHNDQGLASPMHSETGVDGGLS